MFLSQSLFRLSKDEYDENLRKRKHGYHATVRLLEDKPSVLPYVLSGTIRTNGQELQLMAFDTRKSQKSDGSGKTNVKLESIEEKFDSRESVLSQFSESSNVPIVGIDLGEVVTAAACAIQCSSDPKTVRNLTIKRRALYQPTWTGQKRIRQSKPQKVTEAEASIPSNSSCTFASTKTYAQKVIQAAPSLQAFYSSKRVKRIQHDMSKAKRGEFDTAVHSLLRMVGGHIGGKKPDDMDALFAVGLADFSTNKGLPSLHTSFGQYLMKKVSQFL